MIPAFDPHALRDEFPILSEQINGHRLIYFDNAASAQKPRVVLEAMEQLASHGYANVHRGLHVLANRATEAFEGARASVARFVNAPEAAEVIFTRGTTEAMNLLAYGLASSIQSGDEILLTEMEHHSNIVPWHFLRERRGAKLVWAPVNAQGGLDLEATLALIGPRTRVAAITQMSNVLGAVPDLPRLADAVHGFGGILVVDGAQGAVHFPTDVQALGCDAYALTGHKLYGPTGIGALWAKRDLLERLDPFNGGGEMIEIVTRDRVTYAGLPHRFEAGTPAILEAVGLGAALDWLMSQDRAAIELHEKALHDRAVAGLKAIGASLYGESPDKGAVLAFNIPGLHAHDVAQILDQSGIAIRAGHHCAQVLMAALGVSATARASFALYNTMEEVETFLAATERAQARFARVRPQQAGAHA